MYHLSVSLGGTVLALVVIKKTHTHTLERTKVF